MKVIMYHYIRPDNPELLYFKNLHIQDFKRQIGFFKKEFGFLTKRHFIESINSTTPLKGVVLTFDDGLKDHINYVLPELENNGLWGIFYIPVAPFLTGKLLDVHRVHILLGKYGGKAIYESIQELINEDMLTSSLVEEFRNETYRLQRADAYTKTVKRILNYFINYRFREQVIDCLMNNFFPNEKALVPEFYMSHDDLLKLQDSGMVLGSHSVNHRIMSKLSILEQEEEIINSFNYICNIVGYKELKSFCYPYGGSYTFTQDTVEILNKNGCHFSFSVESRDVDINDLLNHKQALPRYDCNQFPYGTCRLMINH